MIIWRGWGILVPVLAVLGLALGVWFQDGTIAQNMEQLGSGIGLVLAGTALFYLGSRLHAPSRGKVVIEKDTGQEIVLRTKHDFFWIKMEYCGVICALIGAGMMTAFGLA